VSYAFTHPRSSWVAPAPAITGPAITWHTIDTVVIHYTAADNLIDGDPGESYDRLDEYMRAMQTSYVTNRGYSLGYNVAVDYLGNTWEIRGTDIRCAANKGHNEHTWAILMLVDGASPANQAQVAATRRLVAHAAQMAGRPLSIVGHGQLAGAATACPGVGLRAQITAGVFTPQPPPPPTEDDDTMRLIQPNDGDPAVFCQAGIDATWVKDEATRDAWLALGATGPVKVPRTVLSSLVLNGPAPAPNPNFPNGPLTKPADFAAHRP